MGIVTVVGPVTRAPRGIPVHERVRSRDQKNVADTFDVQNVAGHLVLSKPVNKIELVKRVQNMLRLKDVTDEVERLRQYIQGMEDGDSPPKN